MNIKWSTLLLMSMMGIGVVGMLILASPIASQGDSDEMTITAMMGDIAATETARAASPQDSALYSTAVARSTQQAQSSPPENTAPSEQGASLPAISPFSVVLPAQEGFPADAPYGVKGVAFSPDGSLVVTADGQSGSVGPVSGERALELWDAETGEQLGFAEHDAGSIFFWMGDVAFSPDGQHVAVAVNYDADRSGERFPIFIWDVDTIRNTLPFGITIQEAADELTVLEPHDSEITVLKYAPDGNLLVSGTVDGTVRLWNANAGTELALFQGHADAITDLQFNANGSRLVSAGVDRRAIVWDMATGQQVWVFDRHDQGVWGASFSPDGGVLATATGSGQFPAYESGQLTLWDLETGELINRVSYEPFIDFTALAFSPDGTYLAAAVVESTNDIENTLRLYDATTLEEFANQRGHGRWIYRVVFAADGGRIATASSDGTARIWTVVR